MSQEKNEPNKNEPNKAEQLANERANAKAYRDFIDQAGTYDLSGIAVPASALFTRSGLPITPRLIEGDITIRVQLAAGSEGLECDNSYLAGARGRHENLGFDDADVHRFEAFAWGADVSDLFYLGEYFDKTGQVKVRAAIIRTLVWENGRIVDFQDDVRGIPIEPVFPAPVLQIPKPPSAVTPIPEASSVEATAKTPTTKSTKPTKPMKRPKTSDALETGKEQPLRDDNDQPAVDDWIRADRILRGILRKPRKEKLGDLRQTIQARQHRAISWTGQSDLIVQGGPGTGKSIVAAHRVAYLLNPWAEDKGLPEGRIMLVGPTRAYVNHVRQVMIELDVDPSRYVVTSIEEMFSGLLSNTALKTFLPNQHPRSELSSDAELFSIAAFAQAAFEADYQEQYLASLRRTGSRHTPMPSLGELSAGRRLEKCYEFFRVPENARAIIEAAQWDAITDATRDGQSEEEVNEYVALRTSRWLPWVEELPSLDVVGSLVDYQWFLAALAWALDNDFPPHLRDIRHVIVDEVQDIYPMEWKFLQHLNEGGRWTLVGDFNQKMSRHGINTWLKLSSHLGIAPDTISLDLGFRSTTRIMALADAAIKNKSARTQSVQSDEDRPTSVRTTIPRVADTSMNQAICLAKKYEGLVAVIIPPALMGDARERLQALDWRRQPNSSRWTHPGETWSPDNPVFVLTPMEARGLEFDAVVLVQPDEFPSPTELYISISRPNRELHVVHTRGLPAWMFSHLDPADECLPSHGSGKA